MRWMLGIGLALFGLLAGAGLSAAVVVLLPEHWRAAGLLGLTVLYGAAAACLYRRLMASLRDWQNLPATVDQLRKDHECLDKHLR